jgi:exopolyphosphatase / guanosine-5'-triphosphate,3'-diphosphate pyrophosphatase
MTKPTASIDLGTNSARLLIAHRGCDESINPILLKRHITRLGGGFSRGKGISAEAAERSLVALRDFAHEIRRHGVSRVRAVATSAVRDAVNGAIFCEQVFRETGIRLEIINGEQEALYTLRGVLGNIDDKAADFLVFDVGGGSTEYTLSHGGEPFFTQSLPLGVVRLTEGKVTCEAMEEKICRELAQLKGKIKQLGLLQDITEATLVGTAGTATTLAAISMEMTDYDYRRVNNHILSLAEIENIYATLLPLSPAERLKIKGLEKGREDLIIAGALITINTMKSFGFNRLKVSDFGLLEGLLLAD